MNRNFIIVLALIVVGMVGLFALSGSDDEGSSSVASIDNPRELQANDYKKGGDDPKAVLIEYGDFGCPGCGALHPLLQQLQTEVGDDLAIVYRHFPLISLHPNAMAAHRAAAAAHEQGKFWEMHDLLYERQFDWTARVATQQQAISIIEGYAQELELDIDKFNADIASDATFAIIDAQQKSGNDLGLTGTPSLILNGEEIQTPRDYDELLTTVQTAIDNNGGSADTEASGEEPTSTEATEETPQTEETTEDTAS